jgi:hypothetical protein
MQISLESALMADPLNFKESFAPSTITIQSLNFIKLLISLEAQHLLLPGASMKEPLGVLHL